MMRRTAVTRGLLVSTILLSALVAGIGTAAAVTQGGYGSHAVIQARELSDRIQAGGAKLVGFYWVDLRNEADFKKSYIPGSINMPYKKLSFLAEKFFSKSDEIVFFGYPDTDHVSVNAVVFMKNKGFMRCSILKGGIGAWTGDLEKAGPSAGR
jgi:rhodanese-related sulfurtransferase